MPSRRDAGITALLLGFAIAELAAALRASPG
jgi:hypothetical protein